MPRRMGSTSTASSSAWIRSTPCTVSSNSGRPSKKTVQPAAPGAYLKPTSPVSRNGSVMHSVNGLRSSFPRTEYSRERVAMERREAGLAFAGALGLEGALAARLEVGIGGSCGRGNATHTAPAMMARSRRTVACAMRTSSCPRCTLCPPRVVRMAHATAVRGAHATPQGGLRGRHRLDVEGRGVARLHDRLLQRRADLLVTGDDLPGIEDLLAAPAVVAHAAAGFAHQQHAGGDVPGLDAGLEVGVGAA